MRKNRQFCKGRLSLKQKFHRPVAPLIAGAFLLPLPYFEGKKGKGEVADVSEMLCPPK